MAATLVLGGCSSPSEPLPLHGFVATYGEGQAASVVVLDGPHEITGRDGAVRTAYRLTLDAEDDPSTYWLDPDLLVVRDDACSPHYGCELSLTRSYTRDGQLPPGGFGLPARREIWDAWGGQVRELSVTRDRDDGRTIITVPWEGMPESGENAAGTFTYRSGQLAPMSYAGKALVSYEARGPLVRADAWPHEVPPSPRLVRANPYVPGAEEPLVANLSLVQVIERLREHSAAADASLRNGGCVWLARIPIIPDSSHGSPLMRRDTYEAWIDILDGNLHTLYVLKITHEMGLLGESWSYEAEKGGEWPKDAECRPASWPALSLQEAQGQAEALRLSVTATEAVQISFLHELFGRTQPQPVYVFEFTPDETLWVDGGPFVYIPQYSVGLDPLTGWTVWVRSHADDIP